MKTWSLREPPHAAPPAPPDSWAEELSISPLLLHILWKRGLLERADMDAFLTARLNSLTPPDKWPQLPQAAELLAAELLAGKKLAVWGDYDVDGITAATLVLDVLETHGVSAEWHIPDRRSEGYGLNVPQVEALAARGCDILLTVDCGISDAQAVRRARELGMTVVVSDHHLPRKNCPPPMPSATRASAAPRNCPTRIWRAWAWPFISWGPSTPPWPRIRTNGMPWATAWTWWPWARWRMLCPSRAKTVCWCAAG